MQPNTLDVRTILILTHPDDEQQVLLLRRSPHKKLLPNLITGIGGKVEENEHGALVESLWREFGEETGIERSGVIQTKLRLTTIVNRGEEVVVLLWYTGKLTNLPENYGSSEGMLEWHNLNSLPAGEMTPTARQAIPFITSIPKEDETVYAGAFIETESGSVLSIATHRASE